MRLGFSGGMLVEALQLSFYSVLASWAFHSQVEDIVSGASKLVLERLVLERAHYQLGAGGGPGLVVVCLQDTCLAYTLDRWELLPGSAALLGQERPTVLQCPAGRPPPHPLHPLPHPALHPGPGVCQPAGRA